MQAKITHYHDSANNYVKYIRYLQSNLVSSYGMLHIQKSRCLSSPTFNDNVNEHKCSLRTCNIILTVFTADVDSTISP